MIVLHGRVQPQEEDCSSSPDDEHTANKATEESSSSSHNQYSSSSHQQQYSSSIRTVMERKSVFSRLSHETQIFGRMVSDLETFLAESGESPEAAWRARILMRSAQETDKALWEKLYQYEKTLYGSGPDAELRQAQTACMKLHRDFKRIHKSLVLTLTTFEKRQKAEISRLGAVGWSTGEAMEEATPPSPARMAPLGSSAQPVTHYVPEEEEDFFDRALREREAFDMAMRQRELTEINKKMHTVNDIYKDLAEMVDDQQDQIDELEDDAESAKFNVRSAREFSLMDYMCSGKESPPPPKCAPESVGDDVDWERLFACGSLAQAADSLRESYGIVPEEASEQSSFSDDSPIAVEPPTKSKKKFSSTTKYEKNSVRDYLEDIKPKKESSRERYSEQSDWKYSKDDEYERDTRNHVSERSSRKPPRNESGSDSSRRRRRKQAQDENLRVSEEFHWMMPFETLSEDVKAVQSDLLKWGKGMMTPTRRRNSGSSHGEA